MELLFESRTNIRGISGKLYFETNQADVDPEPVVTPSNAVDGGGTSIYGSVLHEGGRFRMWYQAWPKDWDGRDVSLVGYAESDDGVEWRKPGLGLYDYHGTDNNLTDLGFHSPSVFIDPNAPADARFRATGYSRPGGLGCAPDVTTNGYYTAHSADGLHWERDDPLPRWNSADVITSMYHLRRDHALVAIKRNVRAAGIPRRSVWGAQMRNGEYSDDHSILIPDEFDDVAARARGYASGDYYGMGMMEAGGGTVGFLWQFRHTLPRTAGSDGGVFGDVDVSLVFQEGAGESWRHAPGRPDFLRHGVTPWASHCIYTASNVITVGDEQWLYFCGEPFSHAWYLDSSWKLREDLRKELLEDGFYFIGRARWKRDRLFCFRSDPEGAMDIELPADAAGKRLYLNYSTVTRGSVRVAIPGVDGYDINSATPLSGDKLEMEVPLGKSGRLPSARNLQDGASDDRSGQPIILRLQLDRARVYAYDVR